MTNIDLESIFKILHYIAALAIVILFLSFVIASPYSLRLFSGTPMIVLKDQVN